MKTVKRVALACAFVLALIVLPNAALATHCVPGAAYQCTTRCINDAPITPRMVDGKCTFFDVSPGDKNQLRNYYTGRVDMSTYNFDGSTGSGQLFTSNPTTPPPPLTPAQIAERDAAAKREQARQADAAKRFRDAQTGQTPSSQTCEQQYPNWYDNANPGYYSCKITKALEGLFTWESLYRVALFFVWLMFQLTYIGLTLASWWFDGAIFYLVLYMGYFINSTDANGVRVAWAAFRDLCNILIIGGFIAVGISTILQISQYAADKFLARLIIAALLVNFSYFFAGAIIDFSNFLSGEVWKSTFLTADCSEKVKIETSHGGQGMFAILNIALSGGTGDQCSPGRSIVKIMGLGTFNDIRYVACVRSGLAGCDAIRAAGTNSGGGGDLFDNAIGGANQTKRNDIYLSLLILTLMATIFYAALAITFMVMALMLVVRFAALIMLLVSSPIGVAGINIPFVSGAAGKWWSALIGQAMFAPIFLILITVSMKVLKGFSNFLSTSEGSFAGSLHAGATGPAKGIIGGDLAMFITYFVGMAMLFISVYVARQIASSTQELAGAYKFAATQGYNMAKGMMFGLPKLGLGVTAGMLGENAERAASLFGKNSFMRKRLTNIATGFNWMENAAYGRKPGDKGVSGDTEERITGLRKDRFKLARKRFSDYLDGQNSARALLALGDKRTPEQTQRLKDWAHSWGEDIVDELSQEQLNELASQGLLSPDQIKAINSSTSISPEQKKGFVDSLFKGFDKMVADAKQSGDWSKVAEAYNGLSDIEKEILYTNRKDLRADEQFLAALKHEDYKKFRDRGSEGERLDMDKKRKSGFSSEIRDGARSNDAKRIRGTLNRMSDNERNGMDLETARAAIPHMSSAEIVSLYKNTKGEHAEAIRKMIEEDEKHGQPALATESIRPKRADGGAKPAPSNPPPGPDAGKIET